MQFVLGTLKCFVNGILQGSFEIKNGRLVEGRKKIVQGIPCQTRSSYISGNYNMNDFNLVQKLFSNNENQIWRFTMGGRLHEVSGFLESPGGFPNPRIKLRLTEKFQTNL